MDGWISSVGIRTPIHSFPTEGRELRLGGQKQDNQQKTETKLWHYGTELNKTSNSLWFTYWKQMCAIGSNMHALQAFLCTHNTVNNHSMLYTQEQIVYIHTFPNETSQQIWNKLVSTTSALTNKHFSPCDSWSYEFCATDDTWIIRDKSSAWGETEEERRGAKESLHIFYFLYLLRLLNPPTKIQGCMKDFFILLSLHLFLPLSPFSR